MFEKRSFTHNEKDYEVCITFDGNTYHIRAFLDGKPANGYTYAIDLPTQVDALKSTLQFNPIEDLINTAISDVKRGVWENFIATLETSSS